MKTVSILPQAEIFLACDQHQFTRVEKVIGCFFEANDVSFRFYCLFLFSYLGSEYLDVDDWSHISDIFFWKEQLSQNQMLVRLLQCMWMASNRGETRPFTLQWRHNK